MTSTLLKGEAATPGRATTQGESAAWGSRVCPQHKRRAVASRGVSASGVKPRAEAALRGPRNLGSESSAVPDGL